MAPVFARACARAMFSSKASFVSLTAGKSVNAQPMPPHWGMGADAAPPSAQRQAAVAAELREEFRAMRMQHAANAGHGAPAPLPPPSALPPPSPDTYGESAGDPYSSDLSPMRAPRVPNPRAAGTGAVGEELVNEFRELRKKRASDVPHLP